MAAGDIVGVSIGSEGWWADIDIEGLATGGTYAFGLGTNNDPATGTPKLVFTIDSTGYDETGSVVARSRTLYGTKEVRWMFSAASIPGVFTSGTFVLGETVTSSVSGRTAIVADDMNAGPLLYVYAVSGATNAADVWTGGTSGAVFTASATHTVLPASTPREVSDGTNLRVRIALSDYVYSPETINAAVFLSGFYTKTGVPNNAYSAAGSNSSSAAFPKVIANWSRPGNQRVTGNFPLACVAFHSSAMNGKPVACVKFTAADTHAHTTTTTVTAMTIDSTQGDAVPVCEYIATMDVSTLDALDVLTCNFIAYPWIGDAGSILDTSTGTAQPTPLFGPITMLNDKSDTYGRTFAAVSSAGNDTTGIAVDRAAYASDALADAAAVATPCLTIGGAYAKICAYNNTNHSRNTGGGGEVILTSGNFSFVGAGSSFGTKPTDWPIIRPADGVTRAQAVIDGNTGGDDLKDMVKLQGITISGSAALIFTDIDSLWFDDCVISATGAATVNNGCKAQYWTRNVMAGFVQGILPSTLWTSAPALVRGNNLDGYTKSIMPFTVLGNSRSTLDTGTLILLVGDLGTAGQQGMPIADNAIVAYNKFLGCQTSAPPVAWGFVNTRTHGCALVQNVFEVYDNGAQPVANLAGSNSATPVNNMLVWHNVFTGSRTLNAYNDTGSTSLVRHFWSEKNNINDYYAVKSDTFTTANGNRVGNWPVVFGVASTGNLMAALTGLGGNAFPKEFSGLKTLQNLSLQANDYVKYTDDKAYKGGADTAGGGTYTLQSTSPAIGMQRDWLLPFDLAGTPRTAVDAAGAYHYGDGTLRIPSIGSIPSIPSIASESDF